MQNFDIEIFKGTTLSNLCEEIVKRSHSKKDQIDILLTEIRVLIKDKNDAIMFLPRIKELLDSGIKNDEQLVKLVAVLQRAATAATEAVGSLGMTDAERQELIANTMQELEDIKKEGSIPVTSSVVVFPLKD